MTLASAALPGLRRVEHIMGMPILVDVRDDGVDEAVIGQLFSWFEWVDATFSTYKDDSEISRVGRGELALEDAHPDVAAVLARCEELRVETDGYFDVLAAGVLDPSGLVKGWSVDRAAAILDRARVQNYAINAAGDLCLRGRASPSATGVSASSIRLSTTRSQLLCRWARAQSPPRPSMPAAST